VIHTDFDLTNHLKPRSFGDAFYWFTRDPYGSLVLGLRMFVYFKILSKTAPLLEVCVNQCIALVLDQIKRDSEGLEFPPISREESDNALV